MELHAITWHSGRQRRREVGDGERGEREGRERMGRELRGRRQGEHKQTNKNKRLNLQLRVLLYSPNCVHKDGIFKT